MSRITLTDGSGRYFDDSSAVKFDEQTRFDGRNHISVPTGSQWEHEALYYTKSGRWVLNSWSQWQGGPNDYAEVGEAEAIRWLSANECWGDESIDSLPASIRERVRAGFADSEI